MKAALYTRVSTEDQVEHGYSLDAQKKRLIEYCNKNNIEIYKIYTDEGISGHSITKRKALQEMLKDAKEHNFDYIVAYKTDRLARNLLDLLTIKNALDDADVELLLSDEPINTKDDTGMTMFSIMGAFAELERKKITERMMTGKRQKILTERKKIKVSNIAYGYLYDDTTKSYVIDETRKSTVEKIYELALQGWSYSKINRYVVNNIVPITNDPKKNWYISDIRNILKNPLYKGYSGISYCSNYFVARKNKNDAILLKMDNIEPYFAEEYWDRIYSVVSKKVQYFKRKHPAEDYIFSDVLFCASCGLKILTYQSSNGYKPYKYYLCNSKNRLYKINPPMCNYQININKVNEFFINFINNIKESSAEISTSTPKNYQHELDSIRAQIALKEKNRETLLDKLVNDVITDSEYRIASNMIISSINQFKEQEKEILMKMSALQEHEKIKQYNRLKIKTLKKLVSSWDTLSNEAKRQIVNSCISKLYINKDGIKKIEFL